MDALEPWLDAAVQSARDARERLAEASRRLRENPSADPAVYAMTEDLSRVIAPLFAVELREPDGVRQHLASAMAQLVTLRDRLRVSDPVGALAEVADALTRLHPNERAMERATRPPPPVAEATLAPLASPEAAPDAARAWSPAPPAFDRRVSARSRIETDIGYHSASNFYTGFTADLGDGGLFIATVDPLPVGTQLTVSFVLPGGHHVVTDAVVRWIREGVDATVDVRTGMGVEFVDLSRDDLAAILVFAAEREPMFHA